MKNILSKKSKVLKAEEKRDWMAVGVPKSVCVCVVKDKHILIKKKRDTKRKLEINQV